MRQFRRPRSALIFSAVAAVVATVVIPRLSDAKSVPSAVRSHRNRRLDIDFPMSYASFIIKPGRPPTILAEEQDRFEFPDRRIRVRIKGSRYPLERRKTEDQIYLFGGKDSLNSHGSSKDNDDKGSSINKLNEKINNPDEEKNSGEDSSGEENTSSSGSINSDVDDGSNSNNAVDAETESEAELNESDAGDAGADEMDVDAAIDEDRHHHTDHPYSDNTKSPYQEDHDHDSQEDSENDENIATNDKTSEADQPDLSADEFDEHGEEDEEINDDDMEDEDGKEEDEDPPYSDRIQNPLDDRYQIVSLAEDRFVGASSVYWSEEERAVYVTDAYGGKIFRYTHSEQEEATFQENQFVGPELTISTRISVEDEVASLPRLHDKDSYFQERVLRLKDEDHGLMLGPVINSYPTGEDLVNLTLAVNTHVVNITWDLSDDAIQDINLPDFDGCVVERERYQRFTIAARDPQNRTYLGISDIRKEVFPTKPSQSDGVMMKYDEKMGRIDQIDMTGTEENEGTSAMYSAAGYTFVTDDDGNRTNLVYVDKITSEIIVFGYDVEAGSTTGRYEGSGVLREMGLRPTAAAAEGSGGKLWVGLDSGEIVILDLPTFEVVDSLSGDYFDSAVADMEVVTEEFIIVLTHKSLYKVILK